MKVTFPLRLKSAPNLREHWAVKAKRVKKERTAAMYALKSTAFARESIRHWVLQFMWATPDSLGPGFLTVTITRIAPRKLDSDNLVACAKSVRDAVAEALGVDDGDERVRWTVLQRRGLPKQYAVEVEVLERGEVAMAVLDQPFNGLAR